MPPHATHTSPSTDPRLTPHKPAVGKPQKSCLPSLKVTPGCRNKLTGSFLVTLTSNVWDPSVLCWALPLLTGSARVQSLSLHLLGCPPLTTQATGSPSHFKIDTVLNLLLSPPTMWGADISGPTSFHPLCPNPLRESLLASDATLSAQLIPREQPGLPNEKQSNKTEERKRKGKKTGQTTGSVHHTIMKTQVQITPQVEKPCSRG